MLSFVRFQVLLRKAIEVDHMLPRCYLSCPLLAEKAAYIFVELFSLTAELNLKLQIHFRTIWPVNPLEPWIICLILPNAP